MPGPITHLPKISRWIKGLVTQRNPIDTPFSVVGMNVVAHNDALIDGQNIEVSSNNTLQRRWGLSQWTTAPIVDTLNDASDGFWLFRNLTGTLRTIFTSRNAVYNITPTAATRITTGTAIPNWGIAQTGDYLYGMNGNSSINAFRWQPDHAGALGATTFRMGIAAPTIPPAITSSAATIGGTNNKYTSLFIPVADSIAGVFSVNEPDRGIEYTASVVGSTLTIQWLYTQFPFGPGPAGTTTGTTTGGTTANVFFDPINGQAQVIVTVTGITNTVAGISTAINNNSNLTVPTYGVPFVTFAQVLGNVKPAGSQFPTANGAAFQVGLSGGASEPVMGLADVSVSNYDLQLSAGTIPIISYFQLPFTTLADSLSGSVTFATRTDNGAFTNTVVNVPAAPNNNLQGLTNAIIAAIPGAVVNLYKTGKTAQLIVLPSPPNTETASNKTWAITANSIVDATQSVPLAWEVINTNFAHVKTLRNMQFGFVWRNEITGHVSTMGPSVTYESKSFGSWIQITVDRTNTIDPQVSYPELYATADGGATFLWAPQLSTIVGNLTLFYYFTDDLQLNPQIVAPLDFANNPPPVGGKGLIKHTQRMWCFVDNLVYYSGGPDTTNGLGDEAWPPANNFAFPGPIQKIESTAKGLMVFLNDDLHVIEGTDASSYYPHPFAYNFGISNPRAEFYDGQTMFFYTTSKQLHAVSPGQQEEIGYDIAQDLQDHFDPAITSVTVHRGPSTDFALFISNGVDRMFRYQPSKGWSTVGIYGTTGIDVINSIETAPGQIQLLCAGPSVGPFTSLKVYYRDYTSYQDAGVPFSASATIGGISLVDPGTLVPVDNIILQMTAAGSDPNVSVLLNELEGDFQQLSAKDGPIFDPPTARPPSTTLRQKRYWCKDSLTPIIERANTLFIKLDFLPENAKSEVLGLYARDQVNG